MNDDWGVCPECGHEHSRRESIYSYVDEDFPHEEVSEFKCHGCGVVFYSFEDMGG